MSVKRLKSPRSLYGLSLAKTKRIIDGEADDSLKVNLTKLLPATIVPDLEPLYAKLPPGWYYSFVERHFVVDPYETDSKVQQQMCAEWKRDNLRHYHAMVNYAVYHCPYNHTPPPEDDTETVYTNHWLIRERLSDLFRIGKIAPGDHPWQRSVEVAYEECASIVKYVRLLPYVFSVDCLEIVKKSAIPKWDGCVLFSVQMMPRFKQKKIKDYFK
ncbi:orf109-like protein [Peridroma alphabaculovirus]|uniref:Orf109-like protein n=1 Tax=Peridroma alphabaculovirus TaxID=1346829 RepID=A0A068LKW9_9ABAC|nr:orf109-like protein [Peridroma alphabaculovirus]AIE47823.1 orf109-like protein [Peridroma alphabaculovirus]